MTQHLVPPPPNYPPLVPAPTPAATHPEPQKEPGFDFRWLQPRYNGTALAAALLIPLGPAPPAVWCAITYAAAYQHPVQYGAAAAAIAVGAVRVRKAARGHTPPRAVTRIWTFTIRTAIWSAATGTLLFIPALTTIVHTLTGAQL